MRLEHHRSGVVPLQGEGSPGVSDEVAEFLGVVPVGKELPAARHARKVEDQGRSHAGRAVEAGLEATSSITSS